MQHWGLHQAIMVMSTKPLIIEILLNLAKVGSYPVKIAIASFLSISAFWSNQKLLRSMNKITKVEKWFYSRINKCKHIKHHVMILKIQHCQAHSKCFVVPWVLLFFHLACFRARTGHVEPEVLGGFCPVSRAHCHNHHRSRTKGVNSKLFGIFLCLSSYDLLSSCPQICSNLAATSAED